MNGFKSKITFINLSNYDIYKFIATTIFGCWGFEFDFEFIDVCNLHVYFLCSHKNMFEPRRAHELTTYKISLVCYTYIDKVRVKHND